MKLFQLKLYIKLCVLWFISGLIVAIPVYVLVLSILPHYVRYIEPQPLNYSILQALVWAAFMSIVMPIVQRFEKKKRAK